MDMQKTKKENWIFMRGLARGRGHWADFPGSLSRLRPDIDAEYVDFPGNGSLSHYMSPTNPRQAIEELRDQSKFIKAKEKVHFCGLSLGGMLGLKWAEYFPTDFQSMVIINSSFRQLSPVYERLLPEGLFWLGKAALSPNLTEREWAVFKMVSNNEAKAKKFLKEFSFYAETHKTSHTNTLRQLLLANALSISNVFSFPIKILNSAQDRMVSPKCSEALAEYLRCEIHKHPTAGHDLPFDEPDWVVQHL